MIYIRIMSLSQSKKFWHCLPSAVALTAGVHMAQILPKEEETSAFLLVVEILLHYFVFVRWSITDPITTSLIFLPSLMGCLQFHTGALHNQGTLYHKTYILLIFPVQFFPNISYPPMTMFQ